jgi:histidinol-phosphate aminotransferase
LAREERDWLYAAFDSLDLTYVKSQANFILLTDLPVLAATLNEELLQRGVFIRPMAAWGMPNAVRVTLGLRVENERLIEALGEILKAK